MPAKHVLLTLCLLLPTASAAGAMPGQSAGELEHQLTHHSLFPKAHFVAGAGVIGTHKALAPEQTLRFLAYLDQPLHRPMQAPVRSEALILSHRRVDPRKPEGDWGANLCDRPMHFTVALVRAHPLEPEEQYIYRACRPSERPDFVASRGSQLNVWLRQVYGPASPLPADFAQAALIGKGTRYYYFADQAGVLVRKRLSIPPLEQRLYRGKRFDYLLTEYSLIVALRQGLAQVPRHWQQDLALLGQSAVANN